MSSAPDPPDSLASGLAGPVAAVPGPGPRISLWSALTRRWWQRIAFRLVVLVLAVCSIPPLTLGVLAMRSARVAQEDEIYARNYAVARWGVEKVQSYLDNVVENARLLTELGALREMSPAVARAHMSYFLSFMEDVKGLALIDALGQERLRLVDSTLVTPMDLRSREDMPEFEKPRAGEIYIGPVRSSEFSEPSLTVALPIRNFAEDTVVGVLAIDLNLKRLWDEVLSFKVGQSGYLYLVDGTGELLAHPDLSLVLAKKGLPGSEAIRSFLKGDTGETSANLEYLNYQGVQVVGFHARIPRLGWGVIVEQPTDEAFASVRRMKIETTMILINAVVVTILFVLLWVRKVTRPLADLAQGARVVGGGDLAHVIPVRGGDELAEVAGIFNWMTRNLRQSFQGLGTLLESTTRLAGVGRREDVLRLAVDETPRVVGDVRCAVLLLESAWDGKTQVRARIWLRAEGADGAFSIRPDADHPLARSLSTHGVVTCRAGDLALPAPLGDVSAPALIVPLLAGQQPRGALVIIRSGTDRPFGETDLTLVRTLANHLTVALQLREAQEQLLRSEKLRVVGEIAAGVAHNFNNVLGGILARSQLLQMTGDPAEIQRGLSIIERAALDGAGIVQRLQDSARLNPATPFKPVALNDVVRDALDLTRPRWKDAAEAQERPIAVETSLRETPPILGDPVGLREVLTNLILNAVDAMPDGGRLRFETATWLGWVTLTVSDTGTGMSEEVRRRIFDPFFTTKGSKGTGLGMSVSYAIVKRHSGEIHVDSVVGQGTTLRLRFPAVAVPEASQSAGIHAAPNTTCNRILVVDDDAYVREVLREVLTSMGHRVEVAESGQQALERFLPEVYDLVITDLGMEVSGREVAQAVKAQSPGTPVVLVTGWGAGLNLADLKRAGVDLLLNKPFQVGEVREIVTKASEVRRCDKP